MENTGRNDETSKISKYRYDVCFWCCCTLRTSPLAHSLALYAISNSFWSWWCVCVYVSIHVHCSLQCYFQNRNEMQKKDSKTQQHSTPSSYTTKSLFEHSITHINNTVTWICNMWSDWKLFRSCCCCSLRFYCCSLNNFFFMYAIKFSIRFFRLIWL